MWLRKNNTRRFNVGFTMVEVMAAMLILAIVCVAYSENQISAISLVKATRYRDTAIMLASKRMAEINFLVQSRGIEEVKDGERGDFDSEAFEGYSWTVTKKNVPAPDFAALLSAAGSTGEAEEGAEGGQAPNLEGPMKVIMEAWGKSIMELILEVKWTEGEQEKSYTLMTHYMASDANAQIQGIIGGMTGALSQGGGAEQP
jgi:prepilin-type N-terminal cleavage/methylation domain-containing protein